MNIYERAKRKSLRTVHRCVMQRKSISDGLYRGPARKPRIVVSLTSFASRLRQLHICVKSLLCQSVKPDAILLFLAEDESEVPESVLALRRYGLEIVCGVNDLGPHKKYFYAMQRYPEDIIITVDDDAVYHRDTIRALMEAHRAYPDCVAANRVHRMVLGADGKPKPYSDWEHDCRKYDTPRADLMATGVGGILYPPGIMDLDCLLDEAAIGTLCPRADDLWLKCIEIRAGRKVVRSGLRDDVEMRLLETSNIAALWEENVEGQQNDACLLCIASFLHLSFQDFTER